VAQAALLPLLASWTLMLLRHLLIRHHHHHRRRRRRRRRRDGGPYAVAWRRCMLL